MDTLTPDVSWLIPGSEGWNWICGCGEVLIMYWGRKALHFKVTFILSLSASPPLHTHTHTLLPPSSPHADALSSPQHTAFCVNGETDRLKKKTLWLGSNTFLLKECQMAATGTKLSPLLKSAASSLRRQIQPRPCWLFPPLSYCVLW